MRNLLKIIALLRKLRLADLLDIPKDIRDSESVRQWLGAVVNALTAITEMTETKYDDKIIEAAEKILNDDRAWSIIHNLVCDFLDAATIFTGDESRDVEAQVDEAAEIVGIAPVLIIGIVQAILALLSFLSKKK